MMGSLIDCPTEGLTAPAPTHAAQHPASRNDIDTAYIQACQAIAPIWPLSHAIAISPHWVRIDMPMHRVIVHMAALGGIQVFPRRDRQLQAQTGERISAQNLDQAIHQMSQAQTCGLIAKDCAQALHSIQPVEQLPLPIDVLDNDPHRQARLSWRQAITHQVSRICVVYFDQAQVDWRPRRSEGLYAFWRETLQYDHSIGLLMDLSHLAEALEALPAARGDAEC